MVTYGQVIDGLSKFIDSEVVNQLTGNQRILLGMASGIALRKGEHIYNTLRNNNIVKMFDIVDGEGHIDIETLYEEARKQTIKEVIRLEIPMIGTLKLNEGDIDKLYNYIKNS